MAQIPLSYEAWAIHPDIFCRPKEVDLNKTPTQIFGIESNTQVEKH